MDTSVAWSYSGQPGSWLPRLSHRVVSNVVCSNPLLHFKLDAREYHGARPPRADPRDVLRRYGLSAGEPTVDLVSLPSNEEVTLARPRSSGRAVGTLCLAGLPLMRRDASPSIDADPEHGKRAQRKTNHGHGSHCPIRTICDKKRPDGWSQSAAQRHR